MLLFKNPAFTKLFFANVTSQLGTTVGNFAFAFYLLDRFSSQPYYATIAELMYSLPTLAVFLFVGVLADRLDRKKIAANSDWIRAGLTVVLLLCLQADWLIVAFVILFLRSAVSKFFGPAETGLLQGVMDPDQYVHAAGLNQSVAGIFMLFGMGLGSLAYQFLGIEGALIIDGVSFIMSGILISLCRIAPEVCQPSGKVHIRDLNLRLIVSDFRDGFHYIWGHKLLLAIISGTLLFGFINGVFAVLPLFMMKYKLSPDNYELYASLFMTFLGLGFLVGSVFGASLIKKFSKVNVLIVGLLLTGIVCLVMGFLENIWLYLFATFIIGSSISPVNVVFGSWFPELVDPKNMGKVNAWMEPLMMLGHSIALGIIALAFPRWISVEVLNLLIGVCITGVGIYYAFVIPSLNRKHNNQQQLETERSAAV
ncbi:MFS transporter [Paenibacillus sp. KN14-4R]|uniref:MFS transporter n=1 Tax=Paenibacillus sp. KN14-4R TaxID=3445773 RepID=UPI003FA173A0